VITAASGDYGFGLSYPASSRYVTAVGGTTLTRAGNARGWTESVWTGAGSGCSTKNAKPAWQDDTGCAKRTVADVSAVADPATGVAVYHSYGAGGWLVFGGTSVAAPIIAGVYALAGNAGAVTYGSYPYRHRQGLFDVASGRNGSCGGYLCTGQVGYDGPSGLGTPNGISAF
jgi:subtilase family serine protease